MGEVVNFTRIKSGDPAFLLCDCEPDGVPFLVVALYGDDPLITALVCPKCEQEIPVEDGVLG